jgi:hypothetical protein
MNKRPPWYDPNTEKSRLLAALEQVWRLCNNSEEVVPCARTPQGFAALQAIKEAIQRLRRARDGATRILLGPASQRGMQTHMRDDNRLPSFGARIDRPKKGKYRRKLKQHARPDLTWRRS